VKKSLPFLLFEQIYLQYQLIVMVGFCIYQGQPSKREVELYFDARGSLHLDNERGLILYSLEQSIVVSEIYELDNILVGLVYYVPYQQKGLS